MAPVHRNEQAEQQKQQHDDRRDLPEQIPGNKLGLHQDEEDDEIDIDEDDDHRAASAFFVPPENRHRPRSARPATARSRGTP
jgi:hypothetical protein